MDKSAPPLDEELLAKAASGDDLAFEELVKRYEEKILNLAYRYTSARDDAEDIAAEAFFRAWKYAKDFKGNSAFSTWLYRITVNTCLNFRKKISRNPRFDYLDEPVATEDGNMKKELPENPRYQPEHALHSRERSAAVRKAINCLPPNQKMALVLSWFEGHSYRQISDIMKLSISSVESLLFRAKENLRDAIKSAECSEEQPQVSEIPEV